MWTERQDLIFSFKMALRSALRVLRGMRKSLTDEQQDRVAEMMVEDLRRQNWKIEKDRPEPEGHSKLMGQ
jgi:hypothetical protein